MTLLYESETPNPKEFYVRDSAAEVVTWQGREALRQQQRHGTIRDNLKWPSLPKRESNATGH